MLEIIVTRHPHFSREDSDLYTTVKIPFTGACLGTSVDVKTLEDTKRIKVKPGTQNGSKVRLKGFVAVVLWMPSPQVWNLDSSVPAVACATTIVPFT